MLDDEKNVCKNNINGLKEERKKAITWGLIFLGIAAASTILGVQDIGIKGLSFTQASYLIIDVLMLKFAGSQFRKASDMNQCIRGEEELLDMIEKGMITEPNMLLSLEEEPESGIRFMQQEDEETIQFDNLGTGEEEPIDLRDLEQ